MSFERNSEVEVHELQVIDAVVRGGGEMRAEDAALTDFALLVRNTRPLPDHGEAMRLDARFEATRTSQKTGYGMGWKPALGVAFSLLIVCAAIVVAVNPLGGSGDMSLPGAASSKSSGQFQGEYLDNTGTGSAGGSVERALQEKSIAPAASSAGSAPAPARKVARTARLTLAADGGKIETIADRVNALTDRYGGYVANSHVRAGEGDKGRASFLLMLPADQYQAALASLSKLAHVRSRAQSSEDITTAYKSTERNLSRLRDRVAKLRSELAAADTAAEKASLRRQLTRAQFAMRQAARQARSNRIRVNYVPLEMTIVADATAADAGKGAIAKAFDRAGKILTGAAAVLIVALAIVLPLALIAAACIFGYRRWRRARADSAIAAAAGAQPE